MSKSIDLLEKSKLLQAEVVATYENEESTAEDREIAFKKLTEAKGLVAASREMRELESAVAAMQADTKDAKNLRPAVPSNGYPTFGKWLQDVQLTRADLIHMALASGRLQMQRLVSRKADSDELDREEKVDWLSKAEQPGQPVPPEEKQLVESVGASGGFLVPVEFRPEVLEWAWEDNPVRARATVLPMRRRQLRVPTLDQTGTAANRTRQYGGVVASWTEEATRKPETQPEFRQINLVAHKLVTYTESSDELLDDSAIALAGLLTRLFGGAIAWEEEFAFLQGTGAGMPLGLLNAGATFVQPRAVAATIGLGDIINMISHHQGRNPVWHITREAFPNIALLNGPAVNPSFVFIPNAREGIPATLFGYPIFWTEKLPRLGVQGDILLSSWDMYLIGDRQQTTIETTNLFRFRTDLTSWRAVHRVDGQPWLSVPVTLADGNWQISPFVILGDVVT